MGRNHADKDQPTQSPWLLDNELRDVLARFLCLTCADGEWLDADGNPREETVAYLMDNALAYHNYIEERQDQPGVMAAYENLTATRG